MKRSLTALFLAALMHSAGNASAQTATSILTYQGRLSDGGLPASGNYDIRFVLFDTAIGGNSIATFNLPQVAVANGLFTSQLDFGNASTASWTGAGRWMQLEVRPTGSTASYTTLLPRQQITSVPFAVRAQALSGNLSASQISGGTLNPSVIANGSLPGDKIALGSILSTHLGSNSVTAAKIDPGIGIWNKSGTTISYTAGAVGIGTSAPAGALLDLEGTLRLNDNPMLFRSGTDANHGLAWYGTGKLWGTRNVDGPVLFGFGGGVLGTTGGSTALAWDGTGKVEVGTASRSGTLSVTTSGNKALLITNDGFVPGLQPVSTDSADTYAGYMRIRHVVEMWPKPDGSAGAKLDVRDATGAATIVLDGATGEATVKVLNITGGSDVAEPLEMPEDVPAGAAVVIDTDRPGEVKMSAQAYDTCVAGIVSGANGVKPGLSLRQHGKLDKGRDVALTGRVYALADATTAPIRPGDLLVTSSLPGHVMKSTDRERSQGAILGKAMSALSSGTGHVLVLVNLQ